jgi:hypothetical protein
MSAAVIESNNKWVSTSCFFVIGAGRRWANVSAGSPMPESYEVRKKMVLDFACRAP